MSSATNVTVGKPKLGGAVYRAPLGTTLPTDAASALSEGFVGLGYVSDEGVTNANSPESDSIKAWGGDTVATFQTGKPDTFKFALIEALSADVLKAVYGSDNVSGDLATGITVRANSKEPEQACWVFDLILKGNTAKRIVVPCAALTELEDIVYADEEAVGYGMTITAVPDDDGQTHYEYILAAASAE